MLKQQDMTETAAAVLHFLPADKWVTPRMMTRTTGVVNAKIIGRFSPFLMSAIGH
ncbi:TPA: hypothetical protein O7L81_004367 [Escherichia coli]|nr:hypothetical protein [Escherichia coli]HDB9326333.1 hypothetical protein [Escherichia coli]HDB9406946.1 hypothetical protein [Escherichia coli]HDB9628829.1 hypothetical protein [Escherichia coli]